jgi:hypothetical protein
MKKIHLRFQNGADDRFEYISKTVKVSAKYFDTIRIVNLGPAINSLKYNELLKKYSNLQIVNFENHYTLCVTSDIIRHHYHDVQDGDWLCSLDSDWRLPQSVLDKMQNEIEIAESEGYNCIYSYQIGHNTGPETHPLMLSSFNTTEENDKRLNSALDYFRQTPDAYGWPLLQKVDKNNTWFDSWFENHGYSVPVPYKKKPIVDMYHLHIRDYSDKEYCKTMTYQCWWYLGHHVFSQDDQYYIINSIEYKQLEDFKLKHKCFTSNKLDEKLKDDNFKDELKTLFLTFKDSKISSCVQMYNMANLYDMNFNHTKPEPPCECNACKYNDGYIKDL